MTKKLHIYIPQPCHENLEAMTPVEKGKFCSTCQKKVFDFTKVSDKEIIEILNSENVTCGRFTTAQLNRNLYTNQQKSSFWLVVSVAILGFLGLGNKISYAQVKNDSVKVETKNNLRTKDTINSNLTRNIKGNVSDKLGTLVAAKILVEGTLNETLTDFDGNFEIKAKLGDVLVVSFPSHITVKQVIGTSNYYEIISNSTNEDKIILTQTGSILKKE